MRAGGCECRHAQTRIHGGLGRHQVMATAGTNDVKRSIGFINWAHALDHYVMLIFPTVVIGLELIYARSSPELIVLGTPAFIAFGVFSLPAGWLGDHWSRRNMMVLFYAGCGLSLIAAGLPPDPTLAWVAVEPAQHDGALLCRLRVVADRGGARAEPHRAWDRADCARRFRGDLSSRRHRHADRAGDLARPFACFQRCVRQPRRRARRRHDRGAGRGPGLARSLPG